MKILAIDSSGLVAGAAILTDDIITAEYCVNFKKTHSQTLLPMIDEIMTMTETDLQEIDAIAIAKGPGSFTGLRIGASTAKGLGLALKKPIIGIPTVDILAYNLFSTNAIICPMMDAKRMQVYTGLYEFEKDKFQIITPQKAVTVQEIIKEINEKGKPVIFVGDGIPVYKEIIEQEIKTEYSYAPPHMSRQRAGTVAVLGAQYLKEGLTESAKDYEPIYLRQSQAERERNERIEKETGNTP